MATKLGRKEMPAGFSASDFKYAGRPANDQGDFGSTVGIADCSCVNQFGDANNDKFYHGGVVEAKGKFFVYLEWGRAKSGFSWVNGSFTGADFQFVACDSESDAREFFAKQLDSKNRKRLIQKDIGGKVIWAAKPGEDGYLVQRLATRQRGLPDAYTIKDNTGVVAVAQAVTTTPSAKATAKVAAPAKTFHPKVIDLAGVLVGGTKTYARAASQATGVVPTMAAIEEVRNEILPAALNLIGQIGDDINKQCADHRLVDLSKYAATIVPCPIPRGGTSEQRARVVILSAENILARQQDLDAFEAALKSEQFDTVVVGTNPAVDPDSLLNATLTWLDPNSAEGRGVITTLLRQSNNRHGNLPGQMRVINLFEVKRPDRDAQFMGRVEAVAAKRKGVFGEKAGLQFPRTDLDGKTTDLYRQANVILTQHGTRSVNVQPIVSTHFRLPQQLKGVYICGANFGHGNYQATDYRKAVGYSSYERSYWGGGGGAITGRGAFLFLCDMIMGDAYRAPSTGSWVTPPDGKDSVFGKGGDRGHRLENDEHVIFDPHFARIHYLVEFTF